MIANATNVPSSIRALVAAADGQKKVVVRQRPPAVPSPPVAVREPEPTRAKRPIPVRIVSKACVMVYACNMRAALTFRWIATRAMAFDGSFATRYWRATQFVGAHVQGVVTGSVVESRKAVCDGCEMRKMVNGHERCGAMDCGCSMRKWWAPTWLSWLRQLVGWDCPRGKWQAGATRGH